MNAGAATLADNFGADFRKAVAVFPKQPLLPAISFSYWMLSVLITDEVVSLVLIIPTVLFLGWAGTEREWYRRAFVGEDFSPSEIWPTSRGFFGRFFRLGLLLSPLLLAFCGLWVWVGGNPVAEFALFSALVIIGDVTLTFVTPALTFATPSARRALGIGLGMLRKHWPAAAPYALTPALVTILGWEALIKPLVGPGGVVVAWSVAT
jgi:hypothetical protein